jgi:hypothetical protein
MSGRGPKKLGELVERFVERRKQEKGGEDMSKKKMVSKAIEEQFGRPARAAFAKRKTYSAPKLIRLGTLEDFARRGRAAQAVVDELTKGGKR